MEQRTLHTCLETWCSNWLARHLLPAAVHRRSTKSLLNLNSTWTTASCQISSRLDLRRTFVFLSLVAHPPLAPELKELKVSDDSRATCVHKNARANQIYSVTRAPNMGWRTSYTCVRTATSPIAGRTRCWIISRRTSRTAVTSGRSINQRHCEYRLKNAE